VAVSPTGDYAQGAALIKTQDAFPNPFFFGGKDQEIFSSCLLSQSRDISLQAIHQIVASSHTYWGVWLHLSGPNRRTAAYSL
jgi:hypothetical protein